MVAFFGSMRKLNYRVLLPEYFYFVTIVSNGNNKVLV